MDLTSLGETPDSCAIFLVRVAGCGVRSGRILVWWRKEGRGGPDEELCGEKT